VEITIHEGRYHIIRRLIESLALKVLRLIRTEFGPISIGDMKPGRHRVLNSSELLNLLKVLNIKP
jgi:23S rRNA pseudouridine2605 synthase